LMREGKETLEKRSSLDGNRKEITPPEMEDKRRTTGGKGTDPRKNFSHPKEREGNLKKGEPAPTKNPAPSKK